MNTEENKKKSTNKKVVIGAVILVALIAIMGILYLTFKPQTTAGSKEITLTVVHADASSKEFDIATDEEYLRGALEQEGLIAGNEGEFGLYVLTVDGETVDEANEEWWCLTKGGETHMLGVDDTPIEDGDQYELTFTTGW
ncbi:MAG TPA: hypothetical protein VJZ01_06540 [Lachnospiraceae bacterium]|jgi:hypothetical protein|nr:hypothetical protein [Lachnospiraceae bacterium]